MTDISLSRPAGASPAAYVELLKPRVMALVVFTGAVGLAVAPDSLHPVLGAVAVLCIAVGAGASGAINMWYDRDIDAVMSRTAGRPIPSGRVAPGDALAFGVVLATLSVLTMGMAINWVAALALAATIAFYVFVYTMGLKRRTPQNIVIGGAAGAFPPVIGWAAATGTIGIEPLSLFLLIFLWTPPHFWALALFRSGDYARAGVPMLPVVAGEAATRRQMLVYTLLLLPAGAAPYALGIGGPVFLAGGLLLGAGFVACAVSVLGAQDHGPARRMFGYSILYLFLMFALLLAEHLATGGAV